MQNSDIVIFNAINLTALVLLVTIFSTALLFRSRIRRCRLWYMFIASWIVYTVGYALLLGHQTSPLEGIPHGLCFVQAILVYTTPSLTAYCTLALLIQFSCHVSALVRPSSICESPCMKNLHYLPVIPVLVSLIMTLVVGIFHPDFIQRSTTCMNCDLQVDTLRYVSVIFVVTALVGALGFIVYVLILLYRHWRALHELRLQTDLLSISMMLRLGLFCMFPILGLGIVFALALPSVIKDDRSSAKVRIVIASIPLVAAITFGTQKDILRVWFCWRRRRESVWLITQTETPDTSRGVPVDCLGCIVDRQSAPPPPPPPPKSPRVMEMTLGKDEHLDSSYPPTIHIV